MIGVFYEHSDAANFAAYSRDFFFSAGLGFSWDKGRELGNYNLKLDSVYRLPESISRASYCTELTTQKEQSDTSRERSFKVNFTVFPSVTDFGRWRAHLSSDFRFEIVSDLFWMMDFYADYGSAPISSEGATSDFGVISSLGYKF